MNYKTNNGIVHKALKSMLERVTKESDAPINQCDTYATEINEALISISSVRDYLGDPDSNTIIPF